MGECLQIVFLPSFPRMRESSQTIRFPCIRESTDKKYWIPDNRYAISGMTRGRVDRNDKNIPTHSRTAIADSRFPKDKLIHANASKITKVAAFAGICRLKSTVEWIRIAVMPIIDANDIPRISGSCRR